MAYFPWNRFRRFRQRPIRKLNRTPHNSIKRWLREKKKSVTIDPFRNKRKTTTEKKISTRNLRTVVSQIYSKVNEVIDYVQRYDEYDKVIRTEIEMRIEDVERLEKEIEEMYQELDRRISWNRRFLITNFGWDTAYTQYDTAAMAQNVTSDRIHSSLPSPPAHFVGVEAGGLLHKGGVVGHGHPHNENKCYCYGKNNGYDMLEQNDGCYNFSGDYVGSFCAEGSGEYTPWEDTEIKIKELVKEEVKKMNKGGRTKPVPSRNDKNYRKELIKKIMKKQKNG